MRCAARTARRLSRHCTAHCSRTSRTCTCSSDWCSWRGITDNEVRTQRALPAGDPSSLAMLAGFFLKLKDAKLPVSIKEYLMLIEGMQKHVISPSIDEFYYLARTTLVK